LKWAALMRRIPETFCSRLEVMCWILDTQ
jgi:hypothetical protein